MAILAKVIYHFSGTFIKITMKIFTELESIRIHIWKYKSMDSQSNPKKKKLNKVNHIIWLQTILYIYRDKVSILLAQKIDIQTIWNKIDGSEISPHIYRHLKFNKEKFKKALKNMRTYSINGVGKTGYSLGEKGN